MVLLDVLPQASITNLLILLNVKLHNKYNVFITDGKKQDLFDKCYQFKQIAQDALRMLNGYKIEDYFVLKADDEAVKLVYDNRFVTCFLALTPCLFNGVEVQQGAVVLINEDVEVSGNVIVVNVEEL